MTKTFKQFLQEQDKDKAFRARVALFEHNVYKMFPGTNNSYRTDPGNTNTMTLRHSHAFAKPNGRGGELYAVNIDGSGHDGYSGTKIPSKHADHLRSIGYEIPATNILESVDIDEIHPDEFSLIVIEDQ